MCKTPSSQNLHMAQLQVQLGRCTMGGMNLARIRKARGLSQGDLADMIGRDTATISRAEKMDQTAKLETYKLCAKALGITLADLFCESLEPVERELVRAYRESDPEKRELLAGLIDLAKARAQASSLEADPARLATENE